MKTSIWWTIVGVLAILGGVLALFFPFPASLAVAQFVAAVFVVTGFMQLFSLSRYTTTGGKIWALVWAVLQIALGLHLLFNPLVGLVSLTLAAGVLILMSGIVRFVFALSFTASNTKWLLMLSAVISVILGIMVLGNIPQSSAILLGTLLGVELLMTGFAQVFVGNRTRDIERASGIAG